MLEFKSTQHDHPLTSMTSAEVKQITLSLTRFVSYLHVLDVN